MQEVVYGREKMGNGRMEREEARKRGITLLDIRNSENEVNKVKKEGRMDTKRRTKIKEEKEYMSKVQNYRK